MSTSQNRKSKNSVIGNYQTCPMNHWKLTMQHPKTNRLDIYFWLNNKRTYIYLSNIFLLYFNVVIQIY